MRLLAVAVLILMSLALAQVPESSDDITVTYESGETGIRGRVVGYSNTPLSGATVMVVGTSYGAMTNASGEYEILNMPVGFYSLKANMVGMHSSTADHIEVRRGYMAVVDFELLPQVGCCGLLKVPRVG